MDDKIPPADAQEKNEVSTDQNPEWIVKFEENFRKFESTREKKQQEEEEQPEKGENTNICKIPADIRKNFDDLYAPCKVSFGPYHHGRPSCKSTEAIKEHIVCQSLVISKKTIHDYTKALRGELKDLKGKYDGLDQKWKEDDESFLRLMIFDGCFLLEIVDEADPFILLHPSVLSGLMLGGNPIWDIDGIGLNKLMGYYRHDMVLLENQLPMLVLEKLFAVQIDKPIEEAKTILHARILQLFFERPWFTRERDVKDKSHVLQLYRHGLLYDEQNRGNAFWPDFYIYLSTIRVIFHFIVAEVIRQLSRPIYYLKRSLGCPFQTSSTREFYFSFPSARELHRVGIEFTTSKTRNLTDISFKGRTLRLPRICVDPETKSMFLNIIAFERSCRTQEVSWYIYFMSMLIQGVDDVCLLQSRDIINIMLISTNEVAELFKTLSKVIVVDPKDRTSAGEYYRAGRMMRERYNKMSNEWRRELRQNYLKSPWAIVSVIAAFFLFALTAIQTAYTILGYYNPK